MSKFTRKVLWLGALSTVGYVGFKMYQRVSAIAKLSKSLPEFLNNVYGEKPKININMVMSSISISVGFAQDIIDNNEDIQTTVTEYIEDFYPALSKINLNISVRAIPNMENKTSDDCCCDEHDDECQCSDNCDSPDENN